MSRVRRTKKKKTVNAPGTTAHARARCQRRVPSKRTDGLKRYIYRALHYRRDREELVRFGSTSNAHTNCSLYVCACEKGLYVRVRAFTTLPVCVSVCVKNVRACASVCVRGLSEKNGRGEWAHGYDIQDGGRPTSSPFP